MPEANSAQAKSLNEGAKCRREVNAREEEDVDRRDVAWRGGAGAPAPNGMNSSVSMKVFHLCKCAARQRSETNPLPSEHEA